MVRTRVLQTLFAYYKDGDKTPLTAKKELLRSFSDTYSVYMQMLDFINELTSYAEAQIEQAQARAKVTHTSYTPNRRFVNNRLAQQIFNNRALRNHVENEHLSWDAGLSLVADVYKKLVESKFYKEYMESETCTYDDDKKIWRKIYTDLLAGSSELESTLDELEVVLDRINWNTDIDVILSFVIKTIKQFNEATGSEQTLLQMFDKEEELTFAKDLLRYSIENREEYQNLIISHLKNWDADRIAYMDRIILQVALAEIINFPNIALEISLNEYIELTKEYSGEKSHMFVNGILNEILLEMKRNNTLIKAITLK